MKFLIPFLFLLTGCAIKQPITPPIPSMVSTPLYSVSAPEPNPTSFDLPPFQYPQSWSNKVSYLERSTNLVDWQRIAGPFYGLPSNRVDTISNQPAWAFYRMKSE